MKNVSLQGVITKVEASKIDIMKLVSSGKAWGDPLNIVPRISIPPINVLFVVPPTVIFSFLSI